MKNSIIRTALVLAVLVFGLKRTAAQSGSLDAGAIGTASGAKPTTAPDGVVRIAWPRDDVQVKVAGVAMKPFAGLGSWAAFKSTEHGAMVMGDTVLFQDEVDAAMDAAFAGGLEVTAIHNHFFFDEPKVYFMHIGGHGDAAKLAGAVKGVWDAVKKLRSANPAPASAFAGDKIPQKIETVSAEPIEKILGQKSESKDGMVKVTIGRAGKMHGVEVDGSMGLTTWAAFSGSDALAVADGDFIMTAPEVQPVLHGLRAVGFHVVALHSHMVGEEPAFYFTHFWGAASAEALAKGLKGALESQANVGKK